MELLCEHQQIKVLLDGRQLCDFTHRIQPLNLVKALQITGDVKLTKVAWKKEFTILPGDRDKCTFFCLRNVLSFSPHWFRRTETAFFHLLIHRKYTLLFFFSSMFRSCREMAGPATSEDLYLDTFLVSQIRRLLMLGCISYPHGSLTPRACQLMLLSPLWWLLVLWLELSGVQAVGLRKGKWEISLEVNKRVWRAPTRLTLSGGNCLSRSLQSISTKLYVFHSTE